MKRVMWTTAVLAVVSVATAVAQPPGGRGPGGPGGGQGGPGGARPPMPIVEALDADRDGVISAEELKKASTALVGLDRNKDGQLTEDEIRPMPGRGPGGPGGFDGGRGGNPPRRPEGERGPGEGRGRPQGRGPQGEGPDGPPPPPNPERVFAHAMEFDADKNGQLSGDELKKFIDEFSRMHADRPGNPGGEVRPAGEPPERPRRPE